DVLCTAGFRALQKRNFTQTISKYASVGNLHGHQNCSFAGGHLFNDPGQLESKMKAEIATKVVHSQRPRPSLNASSHGAQFYQKTTFVTSRRLPGDLTTE